jgi:hypothetical protein
MGVLTRIELEQPEKESTGGAARVTTSLDIGRTLALTLVAGLFAVAALVLYLTDRAAAASGFMAFVGLVLGAGFGLQQGERTGAQEAAQLMQGQ